MRHRQDRAPLLVLATVGLALVTILSVWRLKQFRFRLINETGGAMFYGVLVGLAVRFLPFDSGKHMDSVETACSCAALNITPHILTVNITSHLHSFRHIGKVDQRCQPHMETFDPEVLFNLFLPPIIFHGAYTLNQKRFVKNLGSILTFAFLGTIISCATIGACVYGFTRLMVLLGQAADGDFFLTDCLLFGAIISATDPVSVLGLLSELRVDLDLHTLLFGESVLNDAVAIVLTHAITTYSQMGAGQTFDRSAFFLSFGYFLGVLAGSFLLGFIFTVITALISFQPPPPPLISASAPQTQLSPQYPLQSIHFLNLYSGWQQGIVAVLFCGFTQARYTSHNLSSEGRTRTKQLFEVFNFLGEIFIFSYMGYVLLTFPCHVFKALFISGAFSKVFSSICAQYKQLSIFVSRAFNIYPLSLLLNLGRATKIPRSLQHFMMFAGLRGAVAFSLAVRDTFTEAGRTILTTTLLLVVFTTWVLGTAADPVLHCLDISLPTGQTSSTEDAICSALHLSLTHLEEKNTRVQMLFLDFCSAFNTIIPQHLVGKLGLLGFSTPLCNWLLDFLTERTTFAGDTTVVGLIRDDNDLAYREEVEQLGRWCEVNNPILNIDKRSSWTSGRSSPATLPLLINNMAVEVVSST
ncbi:hypothetical protein L3Q82_018154 [Scortum barcoo]|uniref:Uncharacterized protein n=1 Tax=Scortum barcoo TaxID=214431 RepID=A0ACB8VHZ8_9TELE|nr:hypothetical protein L3Q82_018154 [Scortum barcoo]